MEESPNHSNHSNHSNDETYPASADGSYDNVSDETLDDLSDEPLNGLSVADAMSNPISAGEMIHYSDDLMQAKRELRHLSHTLWKRSIMFSARATIFKLLNMTGSILVILISTSIGAYEALQSDKNIPVIVTSFFIAALKLVYQYFGIGKKGIYYKGLSLRLKRMSSDAVRGAKHLHSSSEMEDLTNILESQMDKLDMDSYKVEYQGEVEYDQGTGKVEIADVAIPPHPYDLENPMPKEKKVCS